MITNPKVMILVNTLTSVSPFVYANHLAFVAETIRRHPEKDRIYFFTPHRMPIDYARNTAAKMAMQLECDYLMFVDDDVLIPPDALDRLVELDSDIAAGLVIIRGYPFNVMAFDFDEKSTPDFPKLKPYNDLPKDGDGNLIKKVKCAAVGFSCALLHVGLLKVLEPPFFVTGANCTEDVYYCLKALESFPDIEIAMDTTIQCGHLLQAEPVEWQTREKMQEFYKPFVDEKKTEAGRSVVDVERILAQL